MQSLMGDRLLKWFLDSSRRRFRHSRSEQAESTSESEGAVSSLADGLEDGRALENEAAQEGLPGSAENAAASSDGSQGSES